LPFLSSVVSEAGRDFSDAAHDLHIEAKVALQRNMLAGCLDRVIDVQKYFDLQNMALVRLPFVTTATYRL
jgi:hypothetical protein